MALNLDVGVVSRNFRKSINEDNYFLLRENNGGFWAEYFRLVDFLNRKPSRKEKRRVNKIEEDRIIYRMKDSPVMIYREAIPVRKNQFNEENRLFAVLDGVTNSLFSPISTTEVVEKLFQRFYNGKSGPDLDAILRDIDKEVLKLNKWYSKIFDVNKYSQTVGTIALVQPGKLRAKHFGDTKLFLLRNHTLEQITEDQQLGIRPDTHIGNGKVEPLTYHKDLISGDLILICSDGITDLYCDTDLRTNSKGNIELTTEFDAKALADTLDSGKSVQDISEELLKKSEQAYEKRISKKAGDDATAIVIRYK